MTTSHVYATHVDTSAIVYQQVINRSTTPSRVHLLVTLVYKSRVIMIVFTYYLYDEKSGMS